jgi:hypothetical protein
MDEPGATHRETTKREFAKQAASFEVAGSIFRDRDLLDWIGLQEADVAAELASERHRTLDAVRWIEQGQPSEAAAREVLAALEAEADGGPATGLEATRAEEGLVIRHLYVIAAGRRG